MNTIDRDKIIKAMYMTYHDNKSVFTNMSKIYDNDIAPLLAAAYAWGMSKAAEIAEDHLRSFQFHNRADEVKAAIFAAIPSTDREKGEERCEWTLVEGKSCTYMTGCKRRILSSDPPSSDEECFCCGKPISIKEG